MRSAFARLSARSVYLGLMSVITVGLFIVFSLLTPSYGWTDNLLNLAWSATPLIIVSTTQTLLLLSGAADLSVGSLMALASVPTAFLLSSGFAVVPSILAGLLCGLVAGVINGIISEGVQIPSFVVTFGTLAIFRGLTFLVAILLTGELTSVLVTDPDFVFLGRGEWLGQIPPSLFIALGVVVVFGIVMTRTRYGLAIRAIGSNQDVAREAGISPRAIRMSLFMASGTMAALAGLLFSAGNRSVSPLLTGVTMEFQSVIAVILGGTRLTGGEGGVGGTLIAVALLTVVINGLQAIGMNPHHLPTVQGILLLVVIGTQGFLSLARVRNARRGVR